MPSICPNCAVEFAGRTIGSHAVKCGVTYDQLFWQKVDKSAGPDKCWPWTGAVTSYGYGHFNSRTHGEFMAHRLAWELTHGRKPTAGFIEGSIRHTCDNPPCCNPKHLILGTHIENMADQQAKMRHSFGERNRHAKLTERQVREIRAKFKRLGQRLTNAADLATDYGVTTGAILAAATGRSWSHIK